MKVSVYRPGSDVPLGPVESKADPNDSKWWIRRYAFTPEPDSAQPWSLIVEMPMGREVRIFKLVGLPGDVACNISTGRLLFLEDRAL